MRSIFRDYMGDMTHHAESTVEQALAHQVGDETSRAYRRGDAFLKRRQVLRDWETYLYGSARKKRRGKSEVTSRSEEHTSELQVTNAHIVCRLLLEKKKNKIDIRGHYRDTMKIMHNEA